MVRGNDRFVAGEPRHPRQDVERRTATAQLQTPHAALFGCSDSRLAAEIIFDKGLGDLFVVRNAGQVISDSVVGSLEYAVAVLNVPLILVLGHDECGAVKAAID
ncbi:MAG: carbonic anhydrase, partial [Microbacteriaceae bacterium]